MASARIGARVEHAAEVADAAAKRVEVDAAVVIVVVVVVVVIVIVVAVGSSGGGGGGGGGSRWGPRRCICCRVRRCCRDRRLLLSLGGAGVHIFDGPRVRGRGALAVAVDGGGAAASRRLVL